MLNNLLIIEDEVLNAFAALVFKVKGQPLLLAQQLVAQAKNGKIVESVQSVQR